MSELQADLYRTHVWKDYVSKTFSSNEQHTPLAKPQPITTEDRRFVRYKHDVGHVPRQPWGRDRSYAGLGSLMLPETHRPNAEPPVYVNKGHKHFGSGIFPFPSYLERNYSSASIERRRRGYPDTADRHVQVPAPFFSRHSLLNPILHSSTNMDMRFHQENLTHPSLGKPPSQIEKTVMVGVTRPANHNAALSMTSHRSSPQSAR